MGESEGDELALQVRILTDPFLAGVQVHHDAVGGDIGIDGASVAQR